MSTVSIAVADSYSDYKTCEKCHAPFSELHVGGDGDWRQTIMCNMCFHTRRAIPLKIIWELISQHQQYPNIRSAEEAQKIDEQSQKAYQAVLAKHAVAPTHKL